MSRISVGVFAAAVACASIAVAVTLHGQSIQKPLPVSVKAPADNPATPAKVTLGRLLFWDPLLSGNRDVACASCHHPRFGYAENRDISIGVNGVGLGDDRRFSSGNTIPFVKRNSQTILNVAFNGIDDTGAYSAQDAPMFWDVRKASLEEQALEPIKALEEMRGRAYPEDTAVATVVARLNANVEYRRLFTAAFGGATPVSAVNLGRALATFQRSLTANQSPFDRYMRGDTSAMTAAQQRGMRRFERVGCVNCHSGPMFSDFKLHVLGVPDNPRLAESDRGAEKDGAKTYQFRTASLRNVELTAPYMHSGIFRTLEDVLEFYDDVDSRNGRDRNVNVSREQLDPLLRRLRGVDEDDQDLIAFLGALTDRSYDRTIPDRVPSGLAVGGRIE
jgi:cytochrome c peroxidase